MNSISTSNFYKTEQIWFDTSTRKQSTYYNIHEAWYEWIKNSNPTYLITLTLKAPRSKSRYYRGDKYNTKQNDTQWFISDSVTLKQINKLFDFVNSKLFNRQYKKGNKFLSGIGCIEYQKNKQLHVHILINNSLPLDLLVKIFTKQISKFSLFDVRGLDIQEVKKSTISNERISYYVTKLHEKAFTDERMIILDRHGVMD